MEQVRDKHKIEHQRYTIQYNDKAIEGLKWNKKLEKRHRIKVSFKNGPKSITLFIISLIKKFETSCGISNYCCSSTDLI